VIELNGHDFDQIYNSYQLPAPATFNGTPTVLIAHTVKGKGLSLAEGTHTWHRHRALPRRTSRRPGRNWNPTRSTSSTRTHIRGSQRDVTQVSQVVKAMRDVWGEKLVQLGDSDPRTVVLDGDLANSTKADKFAKAHPDRFFQIGIAEQN